MPYNAGCQPPPAAVGCTRLFGVVKTPAYAFVVLHNMRGKALTVDLPSPAAVCPVSLRLRYPCRQGAALAEVHHLVR